MTVTVGWDPGLDGALAVLHDGTLVACHDMPTITVRDKRRIDTPTLRDLIITIGPVDEYVVEDVMNIHGANATSTFNFGRGCGIIEGLLVALARPLSYVRPQVWTKAMGVGADKGAHREAARRRWPDHADLFARGRDDGRADAALIALWAQRAGNWA